MFEIRATVSVDVRVKVRVNVRFNIKVEVRVDVKVQYLKLRSGSTSRLGSGSSARVEFKVS